MNLVDIFNCEKSENFIIYNRKKIMNRRSDNGLIKIRIEQQVKYLLDKYADENKLFNFYKKYSNVNNFNHSVNLGLKIIGRKIGIPNLTSYYARHSWATIARNICKIDKYTISEALNHSDKDMLVTDRYIEKDFEPIWEANKKVLEMIF
ncbi:hypothetical protein FACS1894153_2610 [Bacteroidia bacterium]|nr:hypothetical protein FACS1894153_2610 [Bacteroidia bacterium]